MIKQMEEFVEFADQHKLDYAVVDLGQSYRDGGVVLILKNFVDWHVPNRVSINSSEFYNTFTYSRKKMPRKVQIREEETILVSDRRHYKVYSIYPNGKWCFDHINSTRDNYDRINFQGMNYNQKIGFCLFVPRNDWNSLDALL